MSAAAIGALAIYAIETEDGTLRQDSPTKKVGPDRFESNLMNIVMFGMIMFEMVISG